MNASAVANYGPADYDAHDNAHVSKLPIAGPADMEDGIDGKTSDDKLIAQEQYHNDNSEADDIVAAHHNAHLHRIDYRNGPAAFFVSLGKRAKEAATPRFLLCLVAGQLLSLCITCTSVVTTELSIGGWSLPATQTFFVYVALSLIYVPITLYKYGPRAYGQMLATDGWKYFILGTVDVFGNFLTVFGFRYTNLLSCLLLGAWSTPVAMLVTFFLLKVRYHWTQLLGVCICIGGLGVLVTSDIRTGKDWGYSVKWKGDLFILGGATFYGISNGLEEYLVRGRPHYEVVGALGLFGFIVNGILTGAYEHASVYDNDWSGRNVGLLFAYIGAMVILYTVAPLLFRFASSPFYNLSLMTSDLYSLLFGLFLFGYSPYWMYWIGYVLVIIGLVTYFVAKPPGGQSKIQVVSRGKQAAKEHKTGKVRVIGDPKGRLGSIL